MNNDNEVVRQGIWKETGYKSHDKTEDRDEKQVGTKDVGTIEHTSARWTLCAETTFHSVNTTEIITA